MNEDPTKLYVSARKCGECLFTANRVVSGARAAELIRDAKEHDQHFQCHKGSAVGLNLHCRGFFEHYECRSVRFAKQFGIEMVEVDADALAVKAR